MASKLTISPHKTVRAHITDAVRRAILSGELKPKQPLLERELAAQLGTSRAPIRETLRQLEQEGFVESVPYRGTWVATLNEDEVREVLLPTRLVLELFALRHSIENWNEHTFESLVRIIEGMRTAADAGDHFEVVERDLEFHTLLMKSTGYRQTIRVWSNIAPVIQMAFAVGTTDLADVVAEHESLLEAIRSKDILRAEQVLHEHVEQMSRKLPSQHIHKGGNKA